MDGEKRLGVYIHIPFCRSRCAYCDFYTTTGNSDKMRRYANALRQHIAEYAPQLDGYIIDSVYFGGGTPTVFGAERLVSVLDELKKRGHVSLDAEITLEANPESVSLPEMKKLRRAGFNRISLGVQSAKDTCLTALGRPHTYETAEKAASIIRAAGFRNFSTDIMFGLPNQTRDDFAEDILRIAALKPDHISCYALKLEDGTPFYIYRDTPFLPDDDQQADMYLYAVDALARYGYRQYEISNFAKLGFNCMHNLKYWYGDEYLGFGASASSYIGGVRMNMFANLERYMSGIESGGDVVDASEEITGFDLLSEYLMLRLRTTHGISEEEYNGIYSCGMTRVLELLKTYEERGWAQFYEERWRFTPEGFLLSNTLIGDLLDAQQRERTELARPWQTITADVGAQTSLLERERYTVNRFL